jgi:hypothetical protein
LTAENAVARLGQERDPGAWSAGILANVGPKGVAEVMRYWAVLAFALVPSGTVSAEPRAETITIVAFGDSGCSVRDRVRFPEGFR